MKTMDKNLKIKIFTNAHPSALEKEVNEFLHPLKGARIGHQHFSAIPSGMGNLFSVMVEYIEDGTDEDDG